jgi:hypothetical protein
VFTAARRKEDALTDLKYSDGIAAARTMIVLEANPTALQRRLPTGWELAPYSGDDVRGTSLRGANLLIPCHEVYAVRSHEAQVTGLPQLSYVPLRFTSSRAGDGRARTHAHWLTYTEDPAGVPGKYEDGALAQITRSQTFSKERRGESHVREILRRRRARRGPPFARVRAGR